MIALIQIERFKDLNDEEKKKILKVLKKFYQSKLDLDMVVDMVEKSREIYNNSYFSR